MSIYWTMYWYVSLYHQRIFIWQINHLWIFESLNLLNLWINQVIKLHHHISSGPIFIKPAFVLLIFRNIVYLLQNCCCMRKVSVFDLLSYQWLFAYLTSKFAAEAVQVIHLAAYSSQLGFLMLQFTINYFLLFKVVLLFQIPTIASVHIIFKLPTWLVWYIIYNSQSTNNFVAGLLPNMNQQVALKKCCVVLLLLMIRKK